MHIPRDPPRRCAKTSQEEGECIGRRKRPVVGTGTAQVNEQLPVGEPVRDLMRELDGQRRLADPGNTVEHDDRCCPESCAGRCEPGIQPRELGFTAGETGPPVWQLGRNQQWAGNRHVGGHSRRARKPARACRHARQRRSSQDVAVKPLYLGPGLDAELFDQKAAGVGEQRQSFSLPAAHVQSQHQQAAEPLAQRMIGDQRLQFGHNVAVMAASRQFRIEPVFQHGQAPVFQPADLSLKPWHKREILERRAPPQPQCRPQPLRRRLGITRQQPPPVGYQPLEVVEIALAGQNAQLIPGRMSY
jgi:hypothetical protein